MPRTTHTWSGCWRSRRVYVRRMPRMQVYLPDELYRVVKDRGLPASELLQDAVRAEMRRQDLLRETDLYVESLIAEVGRPSPAALARAEAVSGKLRREARPRPRRSA
jgi:hypothetical protein